MEQGETSKRFRRNETAALVSISYGIMICVGDTDETYFKKSRVRNQNKIS